jgi:hypothetical protein
MREGFGSCIGLLFELVLRRIALKEPSSMLDEDRKMLGRRKRPETVNPLISAKEVGKIIARRDRFDSEG